MLQVDELVKSTQKAIGVVGQEMEHFKELSNFSGFTLVKHLVTKRVSCFLLNKNESYDEYIANLYQKAATQGTVTLNILVKTDNDDAYVERSFGYGIRRLGILLAIAEYIWVFYRSCYRAGDVYVIQDPDKAEVFLRRRNLIIEDMAKLFKKERSDKAAE